MSMIRCRFFPLTLAVFLLLSIMMTQHVADSQNDTATDGTADMTTAGVSSADAGAGAGAGADASAGADAGAPDTTVGSTTVGSGGQGLALASTMMTYIVGVILAFLS